MSRGPICPCCNHFRGAADDGYCGWCVDCPTGYCDIPRRFLVKNEQKEENLQGLPFHRDGETDQGTRESVEGEKMNENTENAVKGSCASCAQMKKENGSIRKALQETNTNYVDVVNENLELKRKIEELESKPPCGCALPLSLEHPQIGAN